MNSNFQKIGGFYSMGKRTSISQDSLVFFVSRTVSIIISLLTSIIIARALGPSGKGALSLFLLIPSFVFTFLNLGIHQASIYFMGQNKTKTGVIIFNVTTYAVIVGSLLGLMFWYLRDHMIIWLSLKPYRLEMDLTSILISLSFLMNFGIYLLIGQQRILERNLATIFSSGIAFLILLSIVFFLKMDIFKALIVSIIGCFLTTLYCYISIIKRTSMFKYKFEWPLFKKTTIYGLKSQPGNIMQAVNYRLDSFLVNYFSGTYDVGIYSVAVNSGELLWNIPNVIGIVLFPRISNPKEKFSDENIRSVCRKTLLLTIVGALGLIASAWFIIPLLYGNKFYSSIIPLVILLPGIIALAIHKILIYALMGKGYPQYMTYSGVISFALTILFDFILIPAMGVPGAALASTIAYLACTISTIFWYKKITAVDLKSIIIPQKEDFQYFFSYSKNLLKYLFNR
jgi:O-antigen/teichoic acid export membrane protein